MFDQDQELPDVIDRDAAGAGSMYLNKYFFYSTVIHIICPCPILF